MWNKSHKSKGYLSGAFMPPSHAVAPLSLLTTSSVSGPK